MDTSDILSLLRDAKEAIQKALNELSPEKCSCHERDSSYVCDVCYRQGMRGHMQEGGESKWCDYCGLYTDGPVCEFCGGNTETKEVI